MDKHTQMTDYELELLINEVEGTQMLEAPKRLKDEVLMKSRSIQTQTAKKVTKASVRVELFLYGLKTAVAVAIAILLFGVVNQGTVEGMIPSADAMDRIETNREESNVGRALQWIGQIGKEEE
ncbi:MAG: hypothetical protein ACLTFZ_11115 [Lachnospiraceae bacterium]